jgi:hypothetical protein
LRALTLIREIGKPRPELDPTDDSMSLARFEANQAETLPPEHRADVLAEIAATYIRITELEKEDGMVMAITSAIHRVVDTVEVILDASKSLPDARKATELCALASKLRTLPTNLHVLSDISRRLLDGCQREQLFHVIQASARLPDDRKAAVLEEWANAISAQESDEDWLARHDEIALLPGLSPKDIATAQTFAKQYRDRWNRLERVRLM